MERAGSSFQDGLVKLESCRIREGREEEKNSEKQLIVIRYCPMGWPSRRQVFLRTQQRLENTRHSPRRLYKHSPEDFQVFFARFLTSPCRSARVRRMHDSIMILDAPSCKPIPHIHKRNSAHAVWLRSVPAVAAAYMCTRGSFAWHQDHTCRLS